MKRIKLNISKGFNLIELIVSMAVMSALMVLAAPNYAAFLANMRIKSTAEGINLGLIQARAEAIRRNEIVYFTLNSDTSWEIKTEGDIVLNKKEATESSKGVSINVVPAGSTYVSFNGIGSISKNADNTDSIDLVRVRSASPINGVNPLSVKVWTGGGSLVCSNDCVARNAQ